MGIKNVTGIVSLCLALSGYFIIPAQCMQNLYGIRPFAYQQTYPQADQGVRPAALNFGLKAYDWTWFHKFKYPLYFCGAFTALWASRWFYNYYFYGKKDGKKVRGEGRSVKSPGVELGASLLGAGRSPVPSPVRPTTAPSTSTPLQPSLTLPTPGPAPILNSRPSSPPPTAAASTQASDQEAAELARYVKAYERQRLRQKLRIQRQEMAKKHHESVLQNSPFIITSEQEIASWWTGGVLKIYETTAALVLHMCTIFGFGELNYHDDVTVAHRYDTESRCEEHETRRLLKNLLQGQVEFVFTTRTFVEWLDRIRSFNNKGVKMERELSPIQVYEDMRDAWLKEYANKDATFVQALEAKAYLARLNLDGDSPLPAFNNVNNEFLIIEFQEKQQYAIQPWLGSMAIDDKFMPAQLSNYSLVSVITRTRFQDKNTSAIDAFQMACLDQGRMHFWERRRPELVQVRSGQGKIGPSGTPAAALQEAIGAEHQAYRVVGLIYKKNPSG